MFKRASCLLAGLIIAGPPAFAGPITGFDTFTPLAGSVPAGSLPEATPFQLSSNVFRQKTVSVNGPVGSPQRNGDNWDMITMNENGPQAGRYLFSPYETGSAGVRRVDLVAGTATTIVAPGTQGFVSGDASRWTPWGTYLTAEESWNATASTGSKGRLFEITSPLAAPGSVNFVQRNVVPRTSHEGLAFDGNRNMYFVDELNGGKIYKYTSATPSDGSTYFNAGQTFVLKVGAGGQSEGGGAAITGAFTWEAITDASGAALSGVNTVIADGVSAVDGRQGGTAKGGTGYNRPEDLEIQTLGNGDQVIYVATTDAGPGGNGRVYSINLATGQVNLFVDSSTINQATGLAVGNQFRNPDNLAIDMAGNIYIIEDQPGGSADIWFAQDSNRDGIAESIGRWASMSTAGAEPTGLYFSPFNANIAYVNVQHANSDLDRTIEFSVPEPAVGSLVMAGLLAGAVVRRRRRNG